MAYNPGINYSDLYKNGNASIYDASGKVIGQATQIDPNKTTTLAPMDLSNPAAVDPPKSAGAFDPTALLSSLFSSPTSGGSGGYSLPSLSAPASFANTYKAPSTAGMDQAFQSYIGSITGASPAEAAMQKTEQDILNSTLSDIDLQTNQNLASTKLDALDRGIGGAGQYGDIEANALAQARTGGLKAADTARTTLATTQEQRAADREKALTGAYGAEYQAEAQKEAQAAQIAATGASTDVNSYNDLLKTGFEGAITTGEGAANRASNTRDSMISNLLSYGLGQQGLTEKDQQFYAGLISQEEQNAADRDASYQKALLGTGGGTDFWTGLGESLLTGAAGAVGGPIGSAISNTAVNALTPKKKVVTAGVN